MGGRALGIWVPGHMPFGPASEKPLRRVAKEMEPSSCSLVVVVLSFPSPFLTSQEAVCLPVRPRGPPVTSLSQW